MHRTKRLHLIVAVLGTGVVFASYGAAERLLSELVARNAVAADQGQLLPGNPVPPAQENRPYVGMRATSAGTQAAAEAGVESPSGAVVLSVTPGGPAARAGMARGDLVVQCGADEIQCVEDLESAIRRSGIGSEQRVIVVRGVNRRELAIVVGSQPVVNPPVPFNHAGGAYRMKLLPGWAELRLDQSDKAPDMQFDAIESSGRNYRLTCFRSSWPAPEGEEAVRGWAGRRLAENPEAHMAYFRLGGAPAVRIGYRMPKEGRTLWRIGWLHGDRRYVINATGPPLADPARLPPAISDMLATLELLPGAAPGPTATNEQRMSPAGSETTTPSPAAATSIGKAPTLPDTTTPPLHQVLITPAAEQTSQSVNPQTGLLQLSVIDLSLPAGAILLTVRRTLQNGDAPPGMLGSRWRLNWERTLFKSDQQVLVSDDLESTAFTWDAAAQCYRAPGNGTVHLQANEAVHALPNGDQEFFDAQGRLIRMRDRNGNQVELTYGPDGLLAQIDGPYAAKLKFFAHPGGLLSRVESSTGSTVRYAWATENLTVEVAGAQSLWSYAYDAIGWLTESIRSPGGTETFQYDSAGRVTRRQDRQGNVERWEYDDVNHSTRHIALGNQQTTTTWDPESGAIVTAFPDGRSTGVSFVPAERSVTETSSSGDTVRIVYDDQQRVVSLHDPAGQATLHKYSGTTPFLSEQSAPGQAPTRFQHDSAGNVTEIRRGSIPVFQASYYPDGLPKSLRQDGSGEQSLTYDAAGRIASLRDALGYETRLEHDSAGNLLRISSPLGRTTTRTCDRFGRLTAQTNPAGQTCRYEYGPQGLPVRITEVDGTETTVAYDPHGRPLVVRNSGGSEAQFSYDSRDHVTSFSSASGDRFTAAYDAEGRVLEWTGSDGGTRTFTYGPQGRMVEQIGPARFRRRLQYDRHGRTTGVQDSLGRQTAYEYNAVGEIAAVVDPLGGRHEFEYDPAGRLLAARDPGSPRFSFTYDEAGNLDGVFRDDARLQELQYQDQRLVRITNAEHQATGFSYTRNGLLALVRLPNGERMRYEYDAAGQVIQFADAADNATQLSYTPLGQLQEVVTANGSRYRFEYGSRGEVSVLVDPLGRRRQYAYDAYGRLVQETDPLGRATALTYGAGNRILSTTAANGDAARLQYDFAGRVTEIAAPGQAAVQFVYDAEGRLVEAAQGEVRSTCEYDELDRIERVAHAHLGESLRYEYGATRSREALHAGNIGRWSYGYDAAGHLTTVTDSQQNSARLEYSPAGYPVKQTLPNGMLCQRTYDAIGRLLRLTAQAADGTTLLDRHYVHDLCGNLVEERRNGGLELRYRYDADSRLVGVRRGTDPEELLLYDAVGNRLLSDRSAEYDGADQLVRFGIETFRYDLRGNMIERTRGSDRTRYTYDSRGQMVQVHRNGQLLAEYQYDAHGRRYSKTVNGATTWYVYDGSQLLAELDGQRKPLRVYTRNPETGEVLGIATPAGRFYPLYDQVGTMVALVDNDGKLVATWDLDPYGRPLAPLPDAAGCPHVFATSGLHDAETGLYYFGDRYYDPLLGRFLTPDAVAGKPTEPWSLHAYQYARNNPLRYVDLGGNFSMESAMFAWGAAKWGTKKAFQSMWSVGNWLTERSSEAGAFVGRAVPYTAAALSRAITAVAPESAQPSLNKITQVFEALDRAGGAVGGFLGHLGGAILTSPLQVGKNAANAYEAVLQEDYLGAGRYAVFEVVNAIGAKSVYSSLKNAWKGLPGLTPAETHAQFEWIAKNDPTFRGGARFMSWWTGKPLNLDDLVAKVEQAHVPTMAGNKMWTGGYATIRQGTLGTSKQWELAIPSFGNIPGVSRFLRWQAAKHELFHGVQEMLHNGMTRELTEKMGFFTRLGWEFSPTALGDQLFKGYLLGVIGSVGGEVGKVLPENFLWKQSVMDYLFNSDNYRVVPNIVGKSAKEAAATLAAAGVSGRLAWPQGRPRPPQWGSLRVKSQNPPAGEKLKTSQSVTYFVNVPSLRVPNVVGKPLAEARRMLEAVELSVSTRLADPKARPSEKEQNAYVVVRQSPAPDTESAPQTVVQLILDAPRQLPTAEELCGRWTGGEFVITEASIADIRWPGCEPEVAKQAEGMLHKQLNKRLDLTIDIQVRADGTGTVNLNIQGPDVDSEEAAKILHGMSCRYAEGEITIEKSLVQGKAQAVMRLIAKVQGSTNAWLLGGAWTLQIKDDAGVFALLKGTVSGRKAM